MAFYSFSYLDGLYLLREEYSQRLAMPYLVYWCTVKRGNFDQSGSLV